MHAEQFTMITMQLCKYLRACIEQVLTNHKFGLDSETLVKCKLELLIGPTHLIKAKLNTMNRNVTKTVIYLFSDPGRREDVERADVRPRPVLRQLRRRRHGATGRLRRPGGRQEAHLRRKDRF